RLPSPLSPVSVPLPGQLPLLPRAFWLPPAAASRSHAASLFLFSFPWRGAGVLSPRPLSAPSFPAVFSRLLSRRAAPPYVRRAAALLPQDSHISPVSACHPASLWIPHAACVPIQPQRIFPRLSLILSQGAPYISFSSFPGLSADTSFPRRT